MKTSVCVTTLGEHAGMVWESHYRGGMRWLGMIELVRVVSKVALQMRLTAPCCGMCLAEGPYALIACISGTIPTICMTRLRL